MTNFKKKFTTAIATGAVLANAFVPMAFAQSTTLQITGNGAFSDNKVDADLSNEVTVNQSNDADIDNNVDVDADTGNNSASFNTGGDNDVVSGDADVTVEVDNLVNFNSANIEDCGCLADLEASIEDNGAFSDSRIYFDWDSELKLDQDNDADVDNDVDVDEAETGDNDSDFNTDGDTSVSSGNANVDVTLTTHSNVNSYGGDNDNGTGNVEVDFDFDFGALWSWLLLHLN